MTHLMQIEADFLASAEVRESLNFQSIFNLQSEVSDAKKSKFEKSLKLAKLVHQSFIWFDKEETKVLMEENGVEWSSKEMFINRVFGWQKSFGYKMNKVGKLATENAQVVTKFKRKCTALENNGEDAKRTIEELLKFANAEENGEETSVAREKTFATFSIAKNGLNGDSGYSVRLTESGVKVSGAVEDENIQNKIDVLFISLFNQLEQINS